MASKDPTVLPDCIVSVRNHKMEPVIRPMGSLLGDVGVQTISNKNIDGSNTIDPDALDFSFKQITSAYTFTTNDDDIEVTANTFTVTAPDATKVKSGKVFTLTNSGTGITTIDGFESQTISGCASITLRPKDSLSIKSNGTNWILI